MLLILGIFLSKYGVGVTLAIQPGMARDGLFTLAIGGLNGLFSGIFAGRHAEQDLERLARRRAGAKLGWYIHATVYIAVNLVLGLLSAMSDRHWAIFPAVAFFSRPLLS